MYNKPLTEDTLSILDDFVGPNGVLKFFSKFCRDSNSIGLAWVFMCYVNAVLL